MKFDTVCIKDNKYLKTEIEDTGCGIEEEKLSKVFELYDRIEED